MGIEKLPKIPKFKDIPTYIEKAQQEEDFNPNESRFLYLRVEHSIHEYREKNPKPNSHALSSIGLYITQVKKGYERIEKNKNSGH